MMKHTEALKIFKQRLKQANIKLTDLQPMSGINLMLRFYKEIRCDKCSLEEDADMLLFQWGIYDWGVGEFFELDITRQLIRNSSCEDDDIWQLSLTFKFVVTEKLRQVPEGNRWCPNLEALDEFVSFIENHASFALLQKQLAEKVELDYSCAG
jgi:hypothetical protein